MSSAFDTMRQLSDSFDNLLVLFYFSDSRSASGNRLIRGQTQTASFHAGTTSQEKNRPCNLIAEFLRNRPLAKCGSKRREIDILRKCVGQRILHLEKKSIETSVGIIWRHKWKNSSWPIQAAELLAISTEKNKTSLGFCPTRIRTKTSTPTTIFFFTDLGSKKLW